jgi:hypothetical protein
VLLRSIADEAESTRATGGNADRSIERDIEAFASGIVKQAEASAKRLSDSRFEDFDVISTALAYDSGYQIYAANRIKREHADRLSDSRGEALEELVERLELFGIAKAYFKSLYVRRELAEITRIIPYIGVVSLVTSTFTLLVFGTRAGATLPPDNLLLLVSVTATLGFAPLSILLAFVPRITAVTRRSVSIDPFSVAGIGKSDSEPDSSE